MCLVNTICLVVPFIAEVLIGQNFLMNRKIETSQAQLLAFLVLLGGGLSHMPEMKLWLPPLFSVNVAVNYITAKYNFRTLVFPPGY